MPTKPLKNLIRTEAYRLVLWQLAGVLLLAGIALIISSTKNSFSILMGGFAYGLPNLLFVCWVFRYAGAKQMTQFITAFFMGEMLKLVLSALLFIVILKWLPVNLLAELIGFIGAIVSFWIVSIQYFSRKLVRSEH